MIDYNDEFHLIVDEMGMPLSQSACDGWFMAFLEHVKFSPEQLSAIAKKIAEQRYPTMVAQMDFSMEKFK